MAEVVSDKARPELGLFLRATKNFRKGDLVHREEPLLRAPASKRIRGRLVLGVSDVQAAAQTLREANLFKPPNNHAIVQQFCKEHSGEAAEDELFVRTVLHFNSFAAGPGGREQVVFRTLSRANHSCCPNSIVDGDEGTLRAVCDINQGTTILVSYLDDAALLLARPRRRKELSERWGFICGCDRCTAQLDDMRRFRGCHVGTCTGDLIAWAPVSTLVCERCGVVANHEVAEKLLSAEASAASDIRALNDGTFEDEADEGQAMMRCYQRFASKHPTHTISLELAGAYEFPDALPAKRTVLDGWKTVFGDMPCQLSVDVGRQFAEMLMERGEAQAAKEAFEQAASVACVLDGRADNAAALALEWMALVSAIPAAKQVAPRRPEESIAAELAIDAAPATPREATAARLTMQTQGSACECGSRTPCQPADKAAQASEGEAQPPDGGTALLNGQALLAPPSVVGGGVAPEDAVGVRKRLSSGSTGPMVAAAALVIALTTAMSFGILRRKYRSYR